MPSFIKFVIFSEIDSLPMAGLEPAQLALLPPQDSVSTRFHHIGLRLIILVVFEVSYQMILQELQSKIQLGLEHCQKQQFPYLSKQVSDW